VLLRLIALPPGRDLYVTSPAGQYVGIISLDALKGHLPDREHLASVIAADVVDAGTPPVLPTTSLGELAARFADFPGDKLPVVDTAGQLVGTVSKSTLVARGRY